MSSERRDDLVTQDPAEQDDGFLTRWSERKAMARQGVELPEPEEHGAVPPEADSESSIDSGADAHEAVADGEIADTEAAAELPPIDSLDEDSDYSPFLAAGVPQDVRRDALRKLFHSPKFNVRDGLDDYDLDFTNPEPLGDIITAEMRHRIQVELERLARLEEENDAPDKTVAAVESDVAEDPAEPDASDAVGEDVEVDPEVDDGQPRAS